MTDLEGIDDVLPLTPLQQGILAHSLLMPKSSAFHLQLQFLVEGVLDEDVLERAWRLVVERHTALRTAFIWERVETPYQVVHSKADVTIARHHWRNLDATEQERRVQEFLEESRREAFDLRRPPLMRLALLVLGDRKVHVVWTFHHIVLEGWSAAIVSSDLWKFYGALRAARPPSSTPAPPYAEFLHWLQRQDQGAAEAYWRNRLEGVGAPIRLTIDKLAADASSDVDDVASSRVVLPKELSDRLGDFARKSRVTLNTVMQGAWCILLSRYSGEKDVVFGAALSGRPADLPGIESMVGLFANALPVRARVDAAASLVPWLQELQLEQATMREFDYASLMQVQAWIGRQGGHALFSTVLAFQNWLGDFPSGQVTPDLHLTVLEGRQASDLPMSLYVALGQELALELVFDVKRYDCVDVALLLKHYETVLESMCVHPDARVGELTMLSDEERRRQSIEWNATHADFVADALMQHGFEMQAARSPEARALIVRGHSVSYGELEARANRLARVLRNRGIGRDDRVGVCIERGDDPLVAVLATLKSGAAYVPLDPSFPAERLSFMANDADVAMLVTTTDLADMFRLPRERLLLIDADADAIDKEPSTRIPTDERSARPEDPAYMIYTSGSTGQPKGVVVHHRAVVNFLTSMARTPGIAQRDVLLTVTTLSFDIAVLELHLPLAFGATVVVASFEEAIDGGSLRNLVERHGVTMMQGTPITWRLLLSTGWSARGPFKALVGGETLRADLAHQLLAAGVELWNMYGPTETTVWSTCWRITDSSDITIGKPIDNTTVYVLDDRQDLCPIGIAGELCIGGAGVSLGYWRRAELTAERFVPDRFGTDPSGRLYRTGDRARWRSDGRLEHLGRLDDQVKVRGYRVELGEIESILAEHPAVREAAVHLWTAAPDDVRVVACCVPSRAGALAAAALRKHARSRLPDYMVPQYFLPIEAIPLTPNGKVDRRRLTKPVSVERDIGRHESPADDMESQIAEIWTRLIRPARPVGRRDTFFELGGHSLLAIQALQRMQSAFGASVAFRELFDGSLSEIASSVRSQLERGSEGSG